MDTSSLCSLLAGVVVVNALTSYPGLVSGTVDMASAGLLVFLSLSLACPLSASLVTFHTFSFFLWLETKEWYVTILSY